MALIDKSAGCRFDSYHQLQSSSGVLRPRGLFYGILSVNEECTIIYAKQEKDTYMNELTSKFKGNLTEMQCMAAFMEHGCSVSIPFGDNSKYDFIADINGVLYKIQVKTASKRDDNSIKFSCRSTHVNCSGTKNVKYTKNDHT